jgi:peroxiredoxin
MAQQPVAPKTPRLVDTLAPDFTVTDIKGKTWHLEALRGKTVVLNFWALGCAGCITELPVLNSMADSIGRDTNFVFISLLLDSGAAASKAMKTYYMRYHQVISAGKQHAQYHITCFPTHILIDPRGIVRYNHCGVMSRRDFLKMMRS